MHKKGEQIFAIGYQMNAIPFDAEDAKMLMLDKKCLCTLCERVLVFVSYVSRQSAGSGFRTLSVRV